MRILERFEELAGLGEPLHVAMGVFDGMHLGHQAVVAAAVAAARREGGWAALVTFEPHPIQVIAPEKAPRSLLETLDHKARLGGELGLDLVLALRFDHALAALEAEEFLDRMETADLRTVAVGEDWRFGRGRRGDVALLRAEAERRGFSLVAVPPVMHEGERVSSTRVRQAIRDGNLAEAAAMLGRPYTVFGRVVEGRRLGRMLGFPTANLDVGRAQLPPDGVWVVRVRLEAGRSCHGVANLGRRPTVDGVGHTVEAHLLGFEGDLYGRRLEVEFVDHLRPEMKFADLEGLKEQIARDVGEAERRLAAAEGG